MSLIRSKWVASVLPEQACTTYGRVQRVRFVGLMGKAHFAGSSTTNTSLPYVHRSPHLPSVASTPLLYLSNFVVENMSRHDKKRDAGQQPQRDSNGGHSKVSPLDSAELAKLLLPVSTTPARSTNPPVVPIDQQLRKFLPLQAQNFPSTRTSCPNTATPYQQDASSNSRQINTAFPAATDCHGRAFPQTGTTSILSSSSSNGRLLHSSPSPFSRDQVYDSTGQIHPGRMKTLYSYPMLSSYSTGPTVPPYPDYEVVCPRDTYNPPATGSAGARRHESRSRIPDATLGGARASVTTTSEQ